MTDYVKIHNDKWEDLDRVYRVVSFERRPDSTATKLSVENTDGTVSCRIVPFNQIEWIDEDDR